jgi:DNA helicase-2/ATP-dependent DNA helicase PcrA
MKLSTQQQAAVEHCGAPTLVVAGAGSGKTRTLTAKIAGLVAGGMPPERILAITFTNKAADEMKGRLVRATGLPLERFPWVRTYHSACYRILRAHCQRLGFTPPLQIYSEYQQQKTLQEVLVARLDSDKKYVPAVRAAISHAKNSGDPEGWCVRNPRVGRVRLADACRLYREAMMARNAADFDDLLLLSRDLLRDHADLRRLYQERFDYLLVDEYQDTNDLQEELTRLLARNGNLFCVGDDWQAIYSFRGSNVNHFLTFAQTYPGARIFRLEQNYRSADEIVQLANALIANNGAKMDKRCFSRTRGGLVELHSFGDDRQEAGWVARKIGALHGMGIAHAQMAVLYRTRFCSLAFEQALRYAGIPYHMLGGRGFFERKEIMDLNCYLSAAVFPKDDASFERIVGVPRRGVGPGTLEKLGALRAQGLSLQEAVRRALREKLLPPRVYGALQGLVGLLDDIRGLPPAEALREVIARTGYLEYLREVTEGGTMEYTDRLENIEQLRYTAGQKSDLLEYLEEAALIREDKGQDEEGRRQAFGVNLSTMHAAKGLEFLAVFVVACEEQLLPHWRALESEEGLEEERRLMYVSVTRAARYLFISHAAARKGQYNLPSRFLEEIRQGQDGG